MWIDRFYFVAANVGTIKDIFVVVKLPKFWGRLGINNTVLFLKLSLLSCYQFRNGRMQIISKCLVD